MDVSEEVVLAVIEDKRLAVGMARDERKMGLGGNEAIAVFIVPWKIDVDDLIGVNLFESGGRIGKRYFFVGDAVNERVVFKNRGFVDKRHSRLRLLAGWG